MGTHKFEVGQRVRIKSIPLIQEQFRGLECTIIQIGGLCVFHHEGLCHVTDLNWNGTRTCGDAASFVPLYDGDGPASWADCEWQPNKVTA